MLYIAINYFHFLVGKGVKLPLHARIPILPSDECHRRYNSLPDGHMAKSAVSIESSVICATADGDGNDSCWVCIYHHYVYFVIHFLLGWCYTLINQSINQSINHFFGYCYCYC